MTIDELNKLKPGDMVVIVDQWPRPNGTGRQNHQGKMDKWLGQIMTVRRTGPMEVQMEEDRNENNGGWFWYPEMIDRVLDGFEPPEASDVADFIGF